MTDETVIDMFAKRDEKIENPAAMKFSSMSHPLFAQFKTAPQTALGWTDEQVEAVLAQATL